MARARRKTDTPYPRIKYSDVDFAPIIQCGPDDAPPERSAVVQERIKQNRKLRSFPVKKLVPAFIRRKAADRWRAEQEALERAEYEKAQYRWRAIFRRLIDRIVGALKPLAPMAWRHPFEG